MANPLEITANAVNALSIVLAGRNSVHTWWTGILGCLVFAWLFATTQLYADATLQAFFIITSLIGWKNWSQRENRSVCKTATKTLIWMLAAALIIAATYSWLLHRFTDAFAPVPDSLVLVFSVIAQLMLMQRRLETWWFWLAVNSIAVPLFFSRGLHLTAVLYAAFWINALISLRHWHRFMTA